jgi:hypothetical protein
VRGGGWGVRCEEVPDAAPPLHVSAVTSGAAGAKHSHRVPQGGGFIGECFAPRKVVSDDASFWGDAAWRATTYWATSHTL